MPVPIEFKQQWKIKGVDKYHSPGALAEDMAQDIVNLFVDGDVLRTRPSKRGKLMTPFTGHSIYSPLVYERADFTTAVIFVVDGATPNTAKLYYAKGSEGYSTAYEIKIGGTVSFTLNGPKVQMIRSGRFAYIVDGVGPLYRVNIESDDSYAAVAVTALTVPAVPAVSLTNTVIDPCTNDKLWSSFPSLERAKDELVTNPKMEGASVHVADPPPRGYQTGGDSMDFRTTSTGWAAHLDRGANGSWTDWDVPTPSYYTVSQTYTDLVLASASTITSAAHPFQKTDTGKKLSITSGAGFVIGTYIIGQVDASHVASLDRSAGTTGSTGGHGASYELLNTIGNARVFAVSASCAIIDEGNGGPIALTLIPEDSGSSILTTPLPGPIRFMDLHVDSVSGSNATVSSASYVFAIGVDLGKVITFGDITGWTPGGYTIINIVAGAAVLNGIPAIATTGGGHGILSLDSTHANGDHNYDLQFPDHELSGTRQSFIVNTPGSSYTLQKNVFSYTSLSEDFDFIRYRIESPAATNGSNVTTPSLKAVDVRLSVTQASPGKLAVKANNVNGGNNLGGCWIRRDYRAMDVPGTPLAPLTGLTLVTDTSATCGSRPFVAGDVGRRLVITGGTGFTLGTYKITAVDGTTHAATLSADAGTAASTSGEGVLLEAIDYSTQNVLAIAYDAPASSGVIPFRLGFQRGGDPISAIAWTNPAVQISDATGHYLSCDISTVDAAILSGAQYLYLQITADLPVTVDLSNLFTFGPISAAGNLSVGYADYTYVVTEVEDTAFDVAGVATGNTTDGEIESDGSMISPALTPTGSKAQGQLVLPALVNASANKWRVYRYGGTFIDSYPSARLIAELPAWTDTLDAAYASSVTWDHVTRTMIDDTRDTSLLLAPILVTDRGGPPDKCQAVAEWNNRIWVASGSTIAGSFLITSGQAAGLYFNKLNTPDDPNLPIKGMTNPVGGYDNDPITAIVPLGSMLIILKSRSVYMLTGTDGTNWELSPHLQRAGVGCIAPRANVLVGNELWFLGASGLWKYDGGDTALPASVQIEKALNPAYVGLPPLDPEALAGAAMIFHGLRIYLFAPDVPGDAGNTIAWVFDTRTSGWVKYAQMNVTGACALSQTSNTNDLILAGSDGQLYQLWGNGGDQLTPDAEYTKIPFSFRSRGFGQEGEGIDWWRKQLPQYAYYNVETGEQTALTLGMTAAGCPDALSQTYTVNGLRSIKLAVPAAVRGDFVDMSITGETFTPVTITAVACEIAQGNPYD